MSYMQPAQTNDLTIYLQNLEHRMQALEAENQRLRAAVSQQGAANAYLPRTGLLSQNFLTRAFTVWGHYFVAQLIISIGIAMVYFVVVLGIAALIANRY